MQASASFDQYPTQNPMAEAMSKFDQSVQNIYESVSNFKKSMPSQTVQGQGQSQSTVLK